MALKTIQDATLTGIADAIRSKTGRPDAMTPAQMVSEIGEIGSGGSSFEVIDFIQDNATENRKYIYPRDMTFDHYIVQYAAVETGTYQDGVLTMDEIPTIPTNKNIPFTGLLYYPAEANKFVGKYGTSNVNGYGMCAAHAVVRASISTYGSSSDNVRGSNYLVLQAPYAFGSSGMYIKYRCHVFGWNSP